MIKNKDMPELGYIWLNKSVSVAPADFYMSLLLKRKKRFYLLCEQFVDLFLLKRGNDSVVGPLLIICTHSHGPLVNRLFFSCYHYIDPFLSYKFHRFISLIMPFTQTLRTLITRC